MASTAIYLRRVPRGLAFGAAVLVVVAKGVGFAPNAGGFEAAPNAGGFVAAVPNKPVAAPVAGVPNSPPPAGVEAWAPNKPPVEGAGVGVPNKLAVGAGVGVPNKPPEAAGVEPAAGVAVVAPKEAPNNEEVDAGVAAGVVVAPKNEGVVVVAVVDPNKDCVGGVVVAVG